MDSDYDDDLPASSSPATTESNGSPRQDCSLVSQPAKVYMDPDGDLHLKVGETRCLADGRGQVHRHESAVVFISCSKTLSRASPVWKRLLYGGFCESRANLKDGQDWVVELPDDDARAMAIILNIIHCQFDRLPPLDGSIPLEELYEIAVLTDKYDLTKLVRPWVRAWLRPLKQGNPSHSRSHPRYVIPDLELELWIAWEFGDKALVEETMIQLIRESRLENGNLVLSRRSSQGHKPLFAETIEPPGAEEVIRYCRMQAIRTLLAPVSEVLDTLLAKKRALSDGTRETVCSIMQGSYATRNACDLVMLGSTIRTLAWNGLWPLPEPATYEGAVSDLSDKLGSLRFESFFSSSHAECHPLYDRQLHRVSFPVVLTNRQLNRLREQAKKTGLESVDVSQTVQGCATQ